MANAIRLLHAKYKELKGVFVVFSSQIISGANIFKISDEAFNAFGARTKPIGSIGVSVILDKELIQMNNEIFSGQGPSSITNLPVDKIFCVTESPGLNKEYLRAIIDARSKRYYLAFIWGG